MPDGIELAEPTPAPSGHRLIIALAKSRFHPLQPNLKTRARRGNGNWKSMYILKRGMSSHFSELHLSTQIPWFTGGRINLPREPQVPSRAWEFGKSVFQSCTRAPGWEARDLHESPVTCKLRAGLRFLRAGVHPLPARHITATKEVSAPTECPWVASPAVAATRPRRSATHSS